MKYNKFLLVLILLIFGQTSSGCSFWAKKDTRLQSNQVTDLTDKKLANDVILSEGGKLLVLPFRAGENVLANDELDRISLVIIGGIVDRFKESEGMTNLEIVFSEDGDKADFLLTGFITEISEPSGLGKMFFGKKKNILAVEGKILSKKSSIPVLIFEDSVEGKDKSYSDLGVLIGEKIANFILKHES